VCGAALAIEGGDEPKPQPQERADKYDSEIMQVALPALCSMLLEPVMGVINTSACRAVRMPTV
jgi:hypothetical protein